MNAQFRPQEEFPAFLKDRPPLSEQIKQMREALGMTQSQLAQRAGISQSRLAQIEGNPDQDLQVSTLKKLSAALGCHLLEALVPNQEISKTLDEKAGRVAAKLMRISSGNAALELQLPQKAYLDFQFKQMKEEILSKYRKDLWKEL